MAETKVVNGQTYYKIGDTWGKVNRDIPNQAQTAQMTTQLQQNGTVSDAYKQQFGMAATPTYNYYTPPTNYGVDSQGKPKTEQQWLNSGGLNNLMGKDSYSATKTSNGSYLDTTNLSSQQSYAASLWDEVTAGKRTKESAMSALAGMGLDRYGNQALPSGYSYSPIPAAATPTTKGAIPGVVPGTTSTNGITGMAATTKSTTSTASKGAIPAATPVAGSQASAQAWIDKSRNGAFSDGSYARNNIDRYNRGEITYEQLLADSQRVGYAIPPARKVTEETLTGEIPQMIPDDPYGQMTPEQIAKEAEYRIEQERLAKQRSLDQFKNALKTNFDYSNQLLNDNRVLEDLKFARNNTPFSGRTGYLESQLMRGRQIDDTARTRDYNNTLATAQQAMYDWESLAPEQKNSIVNELTRVERQYGIDVGTLTGYLNGQRTLAGQEFDWNKDPSNPNNIAQSLTNEINRLKLESLPAEIKLGLEALEQEVATGKLNLQEAEYKLKELKDPNSVTNRANALELQMKELEAKNLPEMQKLELQKLRKQIADIGRQPALSPYEKEMQNIKLEAARIELEQLKSGGSGKKVSYQQNPNWSYEIADINANPQGQYDWLLQNSSSYINEYGYDGYNELLKQAKARIEG